MARKPKVMDEAETEVVETKNAVDKTKGRKRIVNEGIPLHELNAFSKKIRLAKAEADAKK